MADAYPTLTQCAIVSIALKILLFPAYRSTDFEVHRNWLAITHSLPVRQWYLDHTSEWTLDYPPFFAYFEWALSQVARLVDPAMLRVYNVDYDGWRAVYFQRGSVIATELLLVLALQMYVDSTAAALSAGPKSRAGAQAVQAAQVAAISVLLSPGLLIIDHIHFQYNGFLYGILVLSLVLARSRSTLLWSGLAFAALLCLKHIYLYLAPAYFVYLLRTYCLSPRSVLAPRWANCCRLGGGIAVVAAAAFGPFAAMGQLPQLLARLFPFSRGLCHAYWAPNVWAVYSLADRVLIAVAPRLGLEPREQALAGATRGLVGDSAFAILPDVTPRACFLLTVLFQAPALARLFVRPSWDAFMGAVTLCGYAAFLFGWHVHEKAILLVVVPFSLMAARDRRHLGAFRPLAVAAHLSLFPLLFTPAEFPIKALYTAFWLMLFLLALGRLAPASDRARRVFLLDRLGTAYAGAGVALVAYCSGLHQMLAFGDRYEFLPLMLTSVYSAVGVIASWLGFMVVYFTT